jgi:hypothetical protein
VTDFVNTFAGELHDCLTDFVSGQDIDISSIRVTLDLICLTLPLADEDPRQSSGRPCYKRWTSYSSQTSMTAVDVDSDTETPTPGKSGPPEYVNQSVLGQYVSIVQSTLLFY